MTGRGKGRSKDPPLQLAGESFNRRGGRGRGPREGFRDARLGRSRRPPGWKPSAAGSEGRRGSGCGEGETEGLQDKADAVAPVTAVQSEGNPRGLVDARRRTAF